MRWGAKRDPGVLTPSEGGRDGTVQGRPLELVDPFCCVYGYLSFVLLGSCWSRGMLFLSIRVCTVCSDGSFDGYDV